ncbi:MAG: radical SAM protein [Eubacterium sp.]|nr:radical SAM protein [Eubacterium sp.]
MRIAFRLLTDKSRKLLDKLMKCKDLEIVGLVDGNEEKWGTIDCKSGLSYISPYKFLDLYETDKIDKLFISPYSGANTALDVVEEMMEMGISKESFLLPAIPDIEEKESFTKEGLLQFTIDHYKTLPRLQYHIADHCNLNCVSCSHFSSLVEGERFIECEEVKRDLITLKRLVKHVERIDILGGEPFLNKEWKKFVTMTREIFRFSEITIITNGTLIWKMSDEDWEFIRQNDVCFRMSLYKPFWKKADEIAQMLKEKGVKYIVNFRVISDFDSVFLMDKHYDSVINRQNCSGSCNQLYHGKMAPCNVMMYVRYFNEYWGTHFPEDVPVENLSSIKDFDELMECLKQPMDLCEHCNIRLLSQAHEKWEIMNPGGKENNDIRKWIYE